MKPSEIRTLGSWTPPTAMLCLSPPTLGLLANLLTKARAHGVYVALVPMWGQEYAEAFQADAEKARRFGRWIGSRYVSQSHVVWIISGEYDSNNNFWLPIRADQKEVINAAAEGLREGHRGTQLMTIHPGVVRTSSADFHGASWLDFNMLQSGHMIDCEAFRQAKNHALIAHDYRLSPAKPVLDGEPVYEDTPGGVWVVQNSDGPRADAAAVRRIESRPFLDAIPDLSLVMGTPAGGLDHVVASRAADGSYGMIYSPHGKPMTVALDRLSGDRLAVWWYNPRSGGAEQAGECDRRGERVFTPPTSGDDQDWVLVLDDATKEYASPGKHGGS